MFILYNVQTQNVCVVPSAKIAKIQSDRKKNVGILPLILERYWYTYKG